VTAATDIYATLEELFEEVFSTRSAPKWQKETKLELSIRSESGDSRVEAGSNTSTATLRVSGGDE
jgi:hypothetical protein